MNGNSAIRSLIGKRWHAPLLLIISTIMTFQPAPCRNASSGFELDFASRTTAATSSRSLRAGQNGFIAVIESSGARLGNVMFVHAAMLGIAATYGLDAVLLEGDFNDQLQTCFDVQTPVMSRMESSRLTWTNVGASCCCCYEPQTFHAFAKTANSSFLVGRFLQSWKYFDAISSHVWREFSFKRQIAKEAQAKLDGVKGQRCNGQYKTCLIVGVHNRRGDYVIIGNVVADADYFVRAMAYLSGMFWSHHLVFALLSDDQAWFDHNLISNASLSSTFDMVLLPRDRREVDLCFLSMTNHVIMSVGTFGWWGAYLSNGTVIYMREQSWPDRQIAKELVIADMMPSDWIGL